MSYLLTAGSEYSVLTVNYDSGNKMWQVQYHDLRARADPRFPTKLNKLSSVEGVSKKKKTLLSFNPLKKNQQTFNDIIFRYDSLEAFYPFFTWWRTTERRSFPLPCRKFKQKVKDSAFWKRFCISKMFRISKNKCLCNFAIDFILQIVDVHFESL